MVRTRRGGSLATCKHSGSHRTPVPAEPPGSLGISPNLGLQTATAGEQTPRSCGQTRGAPEPCVMGSAGESRDLAKAEGPGPFQNHHPEPCFLLLSPTEVHVNVAGSSGLVWMDHLFQSSLKKGADGEGKSDDACCVLSLLSQCWLEGSPKFLQRAAGSREALTPQLLDPFGRQLLGQLPPTPCARPSVTSCHPETPSNHYKQTWQIGKENTNKQQL